MRVRWGREASQESLGLLELEGRRVTWALLVLLDCLASLENTGLRVPRESRGSLGLCL